MKQYSKPQENQTLFTLGFVETIHSPKWGFFRGWLVGWGWALEKWAGKTEKKTWKQKDFIAHSCLTATHRSRYQKPPRIPLEIFRAWLSTCQLALLMHGQWKQIIWLSLHRSLHLYTCPIPFGPISQEWKLQIWWKYSRSRVCDTQFSSRKLEFQDCRARQAVRDHSAHPTTFKPYDFHLWSSSLIFWIQNHSHARVPQDIKCTIFDNCSSVFWLTVRKYTQ